MINLYCIYRNSPIEKYKVLSFYTKTDDGYKQCDRIPLFVPEYFIDRLSATADIDIDAKCVCSVTGDFQDFLKWTSVSSGAMKIKDFIRACKKEYRNRLNIDPNDIEWTRQAQAFKRVARQVQTWIDMLMELNDIKAREVVICYFNTY